MRILLLCSFFFLSFAEGISGFVWNPFSGPRVVWLGPEAYHSERVCSRVLGDTCEKKSEQSGWLYGVRGTFERVRPQSLYWGVEGFYTRGCMDGKAVNGLKLGSRMSDADIEGRLGVTLSVPLCGRLTLIPFGGGGYFWNVNKFHKPETMRFRFCNTFGFWSAGLLSQWNFQTHWSVGVRFKARYMVNGKSRVTDDPVNDDRTLSMGSCMHYDVEVPLSYWTCLCCQELGVSVVPFYRYRHFGGKTNHDFDFFDTKFRIWGVRLQLNYLF